MLRLVSMEKLFFTIILKCVDQILFCQGGIPNSRLILALEPEAASIYCKNLPVDRTLSTGGRSTLDAFAPGTQYLILDAGGK